LRPDDGGAVGDPTDVVAIRLTNLERQIDRLFDLEPAVVKQEVENIKRDIEAIRQDTSDIRKILIGFLLSFAFAAVTTVVAIVMLVVNP
jgi:hypothetical protein